MKLKDLIKGLEVLETKGDLNTEVMRIAYDSREVKKGDLFVCLHGFKVNGHDFVNEAEKKGAIAVLVETLPKEINIPVVLVKDSRKSLEVVAANFYHHPVKDLRLVGITGTNGKTTTSYFIESILHNAGYKVGLIGTIIYKIGQHTISAKHTTPQSLELQQLFFRMVEADVKYAVTEVSSHALELNRVNPGNFDVAVFTNITQDHLDFHKTMDAYAEAKTKLFKGIGANGKKKNNKYAVINTDDPYGEKIKDICSVPVISYGLEKQADITARSIYTYTTSTTFTVVNHSKEKNVRIQLRGRHNVYNALAAFAVGVKEGIDVETVCHGLEALKKVPGRFEVIDEGQEFLVVVDYAHTPDALENVLKLALNYHPRKLITVFGCGGDRDREKRPIMGEIAAKFSNIVIVTSDNPRSEEPLSIIHAIENGVKKVKETHYYIEPDREQAIELAIKKAQERDIVIIAGKGHETYQIYHHNVIPFDDREIARKYLKRRSWNR